MNAAASPWPAGLAAWRALERSFDALTTGAGNPLRHLGALGLLFLWLLAGSGIVLFALLDTSVAGAWQSVAGLGPGMGLLRSLHRYAADAFVMTMLAHTLREGLHGRYAHFRRYAWLTGVPLLLLGAVAGIGGFWLGWDRLAQFSATATAEWLDALPLFSTPPSRNFTTDATVTDRLFSLLVFVHLGVALLVVFGLWAHLQRLARPAVWPPRPLWIGSLAALAMLALLQPVASGPQAQLAQAPAAVPLDWWLLAAHPAMYASSPLWLWAVVAVAFGGLTALPFASRQRRAPAAEVDPANCNGCRRCFDDCPYEAVTMAPHPLRPSRQLAVVDAALCAGCGLCTGACPSSTPFRRGERLATGIDMPQQPIDGVRNQLRAQLAALSGRPRIVVFGCERGAPVQPLAAADVAALPLLCIGMLPPAFVEQALREGADGVVVAGCRDGGCEFRLGVRWTRERLQRRREPGLRAAVPRERLLQVQADAEDGAVLRAAVDRLRLQLAVAEVAR